MRFFKYLVFIFLSIISVNAFAIYVISYNGSINASGSTPQLVCQNFAKAYSNALNAQAVVASYTDNLCELGGKNKDGSGLRVVAGIKEDNSCPASGTPIVVQFNDMDHIPLKLCYEIAPNKFCSTSGNLGTVDGGGTYLGKKHSPSIIHGNDGGEAKSSCKPIYTDSPCDTSDPYGGCYVPPNDGCTRTKDGSIYCPEGAKPPQPEAGCENGATYCKRPPQGCGSDYVPGSFNGEQLCVKKAPPVKPNDPNKPDEPNACTGPYCPKPDKNKDCPDGYYQNIYNGQMICVKDNPNPGHPNPNDPNDPGGGGGDNGGGSSEPTGGDGSGSSINLKPVIDAINTLKTALLSAIDGVSKKITTLIEGQKETNKKLDTSNEHLDKIEDATLAASEALGTANGHLKKIEEATQATSEAVGESNKKLDGVKDSIDGMYKCKNEAYNPSDKTSQKYRECTEQDAKKLFGEEPSMPFKELDLGQINTGLFKVTGQCPAPYKLFLPVVNHTFDIDISKLCDVLAIIGLFIALAAMIHGIAILVENS